MRAFLLSMIPAVAASFALTFAVKAFDGPWPDFGWYVLASLCTGFAIGTRGLFR